MNARRPLLLLASFAATSRIALAHPGHNDGHDLTWDFEHLAAHPLATAVILAILGMTVWLAWRCIRRVAPVAASDVSPAKSG